MDHPDPALLERLKNREATIGVVGLGYVGLPLLLRYSEAGYRVLGFDIDPDKVEQLNAGRSYIGQFESERVARAVKAGAEATSDAARIDEADAIVICVPTPLDRFREPDLSFVIGTTEQLAPYLRKGQVVSLESTTYPGTPAPASSPTPAATPKNDRTHPYRKPKQKSGPRPPSSKPTNQRNSVLQNSTRCSQNRFSAFPGNWKPETALPRPETYPPGRTAQRAAVATCRTTDHRPLTTDHRCPKL
jgi:hypothetical protein